MYTRDLPVYLVRALAPPRLAAGVLVTLALLSAACSDTASRITSAQHLSSAASAAPLLSSHLNDHGNGPPAAASGFTVLGYQYVTCTGAATGPGSITGDVGTNLATTSTPVPGNVILTSCPVTGTVHVGDAAATAAFGSFLTTYLNLAPKTGDVCTSLSTLDNGGVPLPPGNYCFDAAATSVGGVLTLTGPSNGLWTFKVGVLGTGALTGTDFSVVMTGGGQACNVTWWVAQAASMTRGAFQGNILAGAAITFVGPGTSNGNAWAGASGVGDATFSYTTVTGCAVSPGNGKGHDHDNDKGKDEDKDHRGHHGKGHGDNDHRGDQRKGHGDNDHRGDQGKGHGDNDHRGDQGNGRGGH